MKHFLVTYLDESGHVMGTPVSMVRTSLEEVAAKEIEVVIGGLPVKMTTRTESGAKIPGNPPVTNVVVHCQRPVKQ